MKCRINSVWIKLLAASVLAGLLCGCGDRSSDLHEERDPLIQKALVKKRSGDVDGAIAQFQEALDQKPALTRPHLELGVLYDEFKEDYVRAIYHYERYLDKRPKTQKKELIDELIRSARLSYAASLPHQPSGAIAEISALKRENQLLRSKIADLQTRLNPPAQPVAEASGAQPGLPEPAPPAEVTTYRVQSGDTLTKIAQKVYKDSSKWKKIYDANRATMASPQSLKVGQTLIIPQ